MKNLFKFYWANERKEVMLTIAAWLAIHLLAAIMFLMDANGMYNPQTQKVESFIVGPYWFAVILYVVTSGYILYKCTSMFDLFRLKRNALLPASTREKFWSRLVWVGGYVAVAFLMMGVGDMMAYGLGRAFCPHVIAAKNYEYIGFLDQLNGPSKIILRVWMRSLFILMGVLTRMNAKANLAMGGIVYLAISAAITWLFPATLMSTADNPMHVLFCLGAVQMIIVHIALAYHCFLRRNIIDQSRFLNL